MYRHSGPASGLPAPRPSVVPARLLAAVAAGALLLAACGGGGADVAGEPDPVADGDDLAGDATTADGAEGTAPADGTLSFGDDGGPRPTVDDFPGPETPAETEAAVEAREDELATATAPESVLPEIDRQLDEAPVGGEILDAVEPIDGAAPAAAGDPVPRNSSGEPATLDEAGALACANAEIAIGQLDSGQVSIALERIATAAHHAEASTRTGISQWVDPLSTVIVDGQLADVAPLVGFLTACTERGYEL